MEHIERALARAREMRSGRAGEAHGAAGARPSVDGIAPDYTETMVHPHDKRRISEQRLVAYDVKNPAADVYRLLRAQVLQRMKKQHVTTLAVTSGTAGEGATTTAINLAISIALDVNQTVLLIDLNLREPSVHRRFGLNPAAGIDDYLAGKCALKDCLVNPGLARLVLLPARTPKGDAAEAMSSPRMASLVKELRGRYADRIIIFDTPPLLDSGETIGFLPNVDATLFVARSGKTTKQELDRAAVLLQNYRVIGTLLNAH